MCRSDRIAWADALRGPAALMVVWSHLVEGLGVVPIAFEILLGQAAVVAFFIVSGFVLPYGLSSRPGVPFLVGRFVRLWPVFAVACALALWCHAVRCLGDGSSFAFSPADVFGSLLLGLGDLVGLEALDPVVWTLEIEVRAAVLLAVVSPWLLSGKLRAIPVALSVLLSAAWVFGFFHRQFVGVADLAGELVTDCEFYCLMLAGVSLHYHRRGWVSAGYGSALFVACCVGSCLCSTFGALAPVWSVMSAAVVVGVLFVLGFIVAGDRVKLLPGVAGLSGVSYSLYLTHHVPGLLVRDCLLEVGLPPWASMVAAFVSIVPLACGVWWLVERPCQSSASMLGREVADAMRTGFVTKFDRRLSQSSDRRCVKK